EERVFTLNELFAADEVFISSAGTLGLSAYEIDGKKVGGKDPELLKKLQKAAVEDFEKETGYKADIV
ncbi:MAG: D-amino acid aminotransferase, partial [Treponema sp.]|nr:D-amino acid aminotransferase [Treponema sp.]MCR4953644.1 D-amino acid aminotransferase [Treponema sp.]